jgi:peptidoglycan/xylan/chitin deacetylase (PgdA/CDA1 family)
MMLAHPTSRPTAWFAAGLLALAAVLPTTASAVGPEVVAKADLRLWPEPVNQREAFDKASRASILVYATTLEQVQGLTDSDIAAAYHVKSVNHASVQRWLQQERNAVAANYRAAAAACTGDDWTCVTPGRAELAAAASAALARMPAALHAWQDRLAAFAHAYVGEQLRLAALFPQVTSEIDRFGDHEWNGDALPDLQFQLSFDDGPTPPGGTTDETLQMLAAAHRHAIFFLLGENLQARLKRGDAANVAALYEGQCLAAHGWQHLSHAKWPEWQGSVLHTQSLLAQTFPASSVLPYFRPPYGQRRPDSGPFFREHGWRVALWDIDSQDWNAHVSADDVINRIVTLMLIKRHGVMLFHDVHPKAPAALPVIFSRVGDVVSWRDCHQPM